MAVEIERRFLVTGRGWQQHVRWRRRIVQGYLVSDRNGLVVRVRSSVQLGPEPRGTSAGAPAGQGEPASAWLTLKAPAGDPGTSDDAMTRLEFEYAIPVEDGRALLALSSHQLSKSRYGLDLPAGDWVVDTFEASNAPLIVAEVELDDPAQDVAIPSWCGREITGHHELSNAALAARPLQERSAEERRDLLGDGS